MKPIFKFIFFLSIVFLLAGCNSKNDFQVTEWNSHSDKPIIFYISGDSGFNTFTKSMGKDLHACGYDVFALNTQSYFWNQKNPEQTSSAIENYINQQLEGRQNQKVILI